MTTFEPDPPDAATEFAQISAPDHEHDSAWVVRGETTDLTGPVVFLVHPTTASGGWFGDPADPEVRAGVEREVRSQLTAFPGVVWAPHFRQASTTAFHRRDEGGEEAYDLAYGDVARAFSQFLADDARRPGPPRPLVLVGHSQGARHVRALLAEFFDHQGLAARLVAAYVIGVAVASDDPLVDRFPVATGPDDTGALVTYQARLGSYAVPSSPDALCVDTAALATVPGVPALNREGGYLLVPRARAGSHAESALPDGRLHRVEVQVLADVLTADVRRRTRAWRTDRARDVFTADPADLTVGPLTIPALGRQLPVERWPAARGTTFRVLDGLMHVVDLPGPGGDADPLVLLHKLGGWGAEWRSVAEELAHERRVVVIDLPGHGGSARETDVGWIVWPQETMRTVRGVLERIGVTRAHFMGCSLGGVVATWIAAHHRDEVATLTLVGTSMTERLSATRTLELDRLSRGGYAPGWVPRPGQNARAATSDPAILAEQDASRARAGRWVRPSERGVGLSGVAHLLGEVGAPLLYVNGERAGYRSYEARVRAEVPGARVEVVAAAGAFVHQEQPAALVALWRSFATGQVR